MCRNVSKVIAVWVDAGRERCCELCPFVFIAVNGRQKAHVISKRRRRVHCKYLVSIQFRPASRSVTRRGELGDIKIDFYISPQGPSYRFSHLIFTSPPWSYISSGNKLFHVFHTSLHPLSLTHKGKGKGKGKAILLNSCKFSLEGKILADQCDIASDDIFWFFGWKK